MVRIHHIALSRAQLDAIPEAKRRLFILIAHAANGISVLSKLFHFSAHSKTECKTEAPILTQAANAQALVLGRILTGKICECWKLLQSGFLASALSKAYVPQFEPEASQALDDLRRYFGRENAIATVRNKHAFHYSVDQIEAGYRALVDGDPLDIYLAQSTANTFYAFADSIAGRAMLEGIKTGDGAFQLLVNDTARMVDRLNTVIGAIIVLILREYFGADLEELGEFSRLRDIRKPRRSRFRALLRSMKTTPSNTGAALRRN